MGEKVEMKSAICRAISSSCQQRLTHFFGSFISYWPKWECVRETLFCLCFVLTLRRVVCCFNVVFNFLWIFFSFCRFPLIGGSTVTRAYECPRTWYYTFMSMNFQLNCNCPVCGCTNGFDSFQIKNDNWIICTCFFFLFGFNNIRLM